MWAQEAHFSLKYLFTKNNNVTIILNGHRADNKIFIVDFYF